MKKILFIAIVSLVSTSLWADSMRGTGPTRFQACNGTKRKIRENHPNANIGGCNCFITPHGRFDCTVHFSRAPRWVHDSMSGTAPSRHQACEDTRQNIHRRYPNARIRNCECRSTHRHHRYGRRHHRNFKCTVHFDRRGHGYHRHHRGY